eukprot:s2712_g7.t9
MEVVDGVPPIVRGRFGLEQRCAYKHPDLYDEEVPEIDLETAVAQPELGAGCAVRSFVLLGDQNAGKSTMLHSFCRNGDAGFMQLSSLLPILSSSFLNTRMVPESWLQGQDDINQLSLVRDELPFMDTDIARGLVMLSVENFAFFAQEFGLWDPSRMDEAPEFMKFDPQVRFVTLQFTELGGDHLDRLLLFLRGDLATVRAAEPRALESEAEEGFWADMHEVLSASLKLLQETTRTAYFINCRTQSVYGAVLFPGGLLSPTALKQTLRKLHFLDDALGGSRSGEILFYCSRVASVDLSAFDVSRCWADARRTAAAFAEEMGKGFLHCSELLEGRAEAPSQDTGLDLSVLAEVAGTAAAEEWQQQEERAAPLLQFLRQMLLQLMQGLGFRLHIVAVTWVRNYADHPDSHGDGSSRTLCAASVVRNVATLLQRCSCLGSSPDALVAQVAELVLRCAATVRRVEGHVVHGCWVTRADLAEHLEDCEAEQSTVPLPEAAVFAAWPRATRALLDLGLAAAPAQGLPKVALELCRARPVLRVRLREDATCAPTSDVLFVTGAQAETVQEAPDAIALPYDAEFFSFLSSEAALRAVTGHVATASRAGLASVPLAGGFRFESPALVQQLQAIRARLRQELEDLLQRALSRSAAEDGLLGRLWRCASDFSQAELLEPSPGSDEPASKPSKRLRLDMSVEEAEAADRLKALAKDEGLDIIIDFHELDNAGPQPGIIRPPPHRGLPLHLGLLLCSQESRAPCVPGGVAAVRSPPTRRTVDARGASSGLCPGSKMVTTAFFAPVLGAWKGAAAVKTAVLTATAAVSHFAHAGGEEGIDAEHLEDHGHHDHAHGDHSEPAEYDEHDHGDHEDHAEHEEAHEHEEHDHEEHEHDAHEEGGEDEMEETAEAAETAYEHGGPLWRGANKFKESPDSAAPTAEAVLKAVAAAAAAASVTSRMVESRCRELGCSRAQVPRAPAEHNRKRYRQFYWPDASIFS